MIRQFTIVKIEVKEESSGPFIITLNDDFHLIGDRARCLKKYIKKGMNVVAEGIDRGKDLLIENIHFTDGVQIGAQIDVRA